MSPPRHLTKDDAFPPITPNTIRLYSMQYCPYALRARLALAKHDVDYELINVDLHKKPEWFLEKYPVGTVPVLEIDRGVLGGSLLIAEYIEDVFAKNGNRSLATDPFEKGQTKMLIDDIFSKAISSIYQRLKKIKNWEESFFKNVGELEKILKSSKFFVGDEITYADYMIWPWLRLIGPVIDDVLSSGKFTNLERWIKDVSEDETIKKCHTPPEVLQEFCKGYSSRQFVYDLE